MKDNINIGIDIGGSHVAIGLVSDEGEILEQFEKDYTVEEKKNLINVAIDFIVKTVEDLKSSYTFSKIGIGVPGTISKGIILKSVNLGLENYDLKKVLEDRLNITINIKNDAKCAAVGEYVYGVAKNYENVLFLTLGTGIGGAYLYKGKLLEGTNYSGTEFGHIIIKENGILCRCGKAGCFERYGSILTYKTKVIERLGLSHDLAGPELRKIIENSQDKIQDIQDEYLNDLSIGLSNLINIFEPDCVILGGGFARYDYILGAKLKEKLLNSNLLFNKRDDIIIMPASLGNEAGIIGASLI